MRSLFYRTVSLDDDGIGCANTQALRKVLAKATAPRKPSEMERWVPALATGRWNSKRTLGREFCRPGPAQPGPADPAGGTRIYKACGSSCTPWLACCLSVPCEALCI